ncbi:MAG: hypothetical protein M3R38_29965 [Actinomycetota bacterium]|nr:hypothetical protein [Actinomycetota bacterium]
MIWSGAAWTRRPGLRWFVLVAAVLGGLANLPVVILWVVGGLEVLAGAGASLGEILPSALIALIASLATSEIVLRVFELPGRSLGHRYGVVVASVCLGGVLMGAPLAVLYAIDGTLGADPTRSVYAILYADPVALLGVVPVALIGAVFGLVIGLAEGLILGLPLAAALGALSDD